MSDKLKVLPQSKGEQKAAKKVLKAARNKRNKTPVSYNVHKAASNKAGLIK